MRTILSIQMTLALPSLPYEPPRIHPQYLPGRLRRAARLQTLGCRLRLPRRSHPGSQTQIQEPGRRAHHRARQVTIGNKELGWMFENCFPNTLDTTVDFEVIDGRPDTYVITGDIDAMWLRDSTAQVWPYLPLMKEDPALQQLIAGVINRQARCILKDPYANAFYKDESKVSDWKSDRTEMKPGVHERKWEIDSLCYPIRLAYHYWKLTGDASPCGRHLARRPPAARSRPSANSSARPAKALTASSAAPRSQSDTARRARLRQPGQTRRPHLLHVPAQR